MIVCIAEKPSVAADIAHVVGATERHEGYYEGGGYQVTWTFGHLCELKYPEDYRPEWRRWSLGALPMVPPRFGIRLKDDKGVQRQFAIIQRLMLAADAIVNCGDAGQEGELIQRWVMQKAGATCPVQRLWISALTEESIREGLATLRPADDYRPLYEAGLCRAIGDWLLGMNATRLYTLKYGGQRAPGSPPLSIGRVQTPTLALIVRRGQEIANFRPEPYWVLTTLYRDATFTALAADAAAQADDDVPTDDDAAGTAHKGRAARRGYTSEDEARAALERVSASPFTVTGLTRREGSEAPPRLFDLTSLQVECNSRLGFTAERTLQLAQSLYEKKATTYPRVDTTYLNDELHAKCPQILRSLAADYDALLAPLRGRPLMKRKKVFDSKKVTDHHAIIPTGQPPRGLTQEEQQVFDLVARRFIGVFHPDCRFQQTTVTGRAADVDFRATGKVITEPGWRVVMPPPVKGSAETEGKEARGEADHLLPPFTVGESGPHTPQLAQKTTQPPKPYTEASLLRAMETAGRSVSDDELRDALKENGIGRPSTRAAIIETLFRRQYVRRQGKQLVATPTGCELIATIKSPLLKSAELTGMWEKKLREIERREYSATQFIDELKAMVGQLVVEVLVDNDARTIALAPTPAPTAQGRRSTASPTAGAAADAAPAPADAAPKKRRTVVRAGSPCPKCGEGKVVKGHTAYGCSRWREGCDWRKPFARKKKPEA